jgi:hypothetical protein
MRGTVPEVTVTRGSRRARVLVGPFVGRSARGAPAGRTRVTDRRGPVLFPDGRRMIGDLTEILRWKAHLLR